MTRRKRIPLVHLYGGLARGGAVLTACGKLKAHLPGRDTVTLHALSKVNCPACLTEMEAP